MPHVISALGCALRLCQRFSKISQKTLTTPSPPGGLQLALGHLYCHPRQVRVHHLKESGTGRTGGMSSTGCAAQCQKARRHLAATNDNDSWQNGKLTTPAAAGNLKQETSPGVLAIGHCGSTGHSWPVGTAIVLSRVLTIFSMILQGNWALIPRL